MTLESRAVIGLQVCFSCFPKAPHLHFHWLASGRCIRWKLSVVCGLPSADAYFLPNNKARFVCGNHHAGPKRDSSSHEEKSRAPPTQPSPVSKSTIVKKEEPKPAVSEPKPAASEQKPVASEPKPAALEPQPVASEPVSPPVVKKKSSYKPPKKVKKGGLWWRFDLNRFVLHLLFHLVKLSCRIRSLDHLIQLRKVTFSNSRPWTRRECEPGLWKVWRKCQSWTLFDLKISCKCLTEHRKSWTVPDILLTQRLYLPHVSF